MIRLKGQEGVNLSLEISELQFLLLFFVQQSLVPRTKYEHFLRLIMKYCPLAGHRGPAGDLIIVGVLSKLCPSDKRNVTKIHIQKFFATSTDPKTRFSDSFRNYMLQPRCQICYPSNQGHPYSSGTFKDFRLHHVLSSRSRVSTFLPASTTLNPDVQL